MKKLQLISCGKKIKVLLIHRHLSIESKYKMACSCRNLQWPSTGENRWVETKHTNYAVGHGRPLCFLFERARAPRPFLLVKGTLWGNWKQFKGTKAMTMASGLGLSCPWSWPLCCFNSFPRDCPMPKAKLKWPCSLKDKFPVLSIPCKYHSNPLGKFAKTFPKATFPLYTVPQMHTRVDWLIQLSQNRHV